MGVVDNIEDGVVGGAEYGDSYAHHVDGAVKVSALVTSSQFLQVEEIATC